MSKEIEKLATMKEFKSRKTLNGGSQILYEFKNGYGASVVYSHMSYGQENGLLELAVLKDESCCYDTPITDNVIGFLTATDALALIDKIEALPPAEN